ncbi:MAG TPA: hypothetical protein VG204_00785 [Terriglobia bacterium]|nr:hypothetical protein [Terriglobia bacterium]
MPRVCTVCSNEDRKRIDRELVSGVSIRGISRTFRVSEDALSRHKAHVGQAIQRAGERREERYEDGLLGKIERVQDKLWAVLARMESEGDHRGSIVALREIRESLETIDRMTTREAGGEGDLAAILRRTTECLNEGLKRVRAQRESEKP